MMHDRRRWCLGCVASPEDLARMLSQKSWTLCTGFYVAGHERYILLNDSTHEDGGQEYAVLLHSAEMSGCWHQVESVTFGWCSYEDALSHIQSILAGACDPFRGQRDLFPRLDPPDGHHRCHLCA